MTKTTPCSTCPWRKTSTVGGAEIPGFNIDMMRRLSNTVGEGDALRPIMACHGSEIGEETACVGYLAVEGWSNISVRLLAARNVIDLHAVEDACKNLDLWPSFHEMLTAYEDACAKDRNK